ARRSVARQAGNRASTDLQWNWIASGTTWSIRANARSGSNGHRLRYPRYRRIARAAVALSAVDAGTAHLSTAGRTRPRARAYHGRFLGRRDRAAVRRATISTMRKADSRGHGDGNAN